MDDRINFKTFFFLIRNQVYSNKHEEINAKKREKAKARERQIRHNCSKIKRNKLYRKKKNLSTKHHHGKRTVYLVSAPCYYSKAEEIFLQESDKVLREGGNPSRPPPCPSNKNCLFSLILITPLIFVASPKQPLPVLHHACCKAFSNI